MEEQEIDEFGAHFDEASRNFRSKSTTTMATTMKSSIKVLYCGVCSLPIEYCIEVGDSFEECSKWLRENHLNIYLSERENLLLESRYKWLGTLSILPFEILFEQIIPMLTFQSKLALRSTCKRFLAEINKRCDLKMYIRISILELQPVVKSSPPTNISPTTSINNINNSLLSPKQTNMNGQTTSPPSSKVISHSLLNAALLSASKAPAGFSNNSKKNEQQQQQNVQYDLGFQTPSKTEISNNITIPHPNFSNPFLKAPLTPPNFSRSSSPIAPTFPRIKQSGGSPKGYHLILRQLRSAKTPIELIEIAVDNTHKWHWTLGSNFLRLLPRKLLKTLSISKVFLSSMNGIPPCITSLILKEVSLPKTTWALKLPNLRNLEILHCTGVVIKDIVQYFPKTLESFNTDVPLTALDFSLMPSGLKSLQVAYIPTTILSLNSESDASNSASSSTPKIMKPPLMNLKRLTISGALFRDDDLALFPQRFPELEHLAIGGSISDKALALLSPKLLSATIWSWEFTAEAQKFIPQSIPTVVLKLSFLYQIIYSRSP